MLRPRGGLALGMVVAAACAKTAPARDLREVGPGQTPRDAQEPDEEASTHVDQPVSAVGQDHTGGADTLVEGSVLAGTWQLDGRCESGTCANRCVCEYVVCLELHAGAEHCDDAQDECFDECDAP